MTAKKVKPPAKHHYVPEMLSKRFRDADGYLWLYDRAKAKHGIQKVTPSGAFWERNLNTLSLTGGAKDTSIENMFASIEDPVSRVLDAVTSALRQETLPNFDEGLHRLLAQFIFYQFKRPPDRFRKIITPERLDQYLAEMPAALEARFGRSLTAEELAETTSDATRSYIHKNAPAAAVAQPGTILMEQLLDASLSFSFAEAGSFVIGSNPVISVKGNAATGQSSLVMSLPIAPDILMIFGPPGPQNSVGAHTGVQVDAFNNLVLNQSTAFASSSSARTTALLAGLSDPSLTSTPPAASAEPSGG